MNPSLSPFFLVWLAVAAVTLPVMLHSGHRIHVLCSVDASVLGRELSRLLATDDRRRAALLAAVGESEAACQLAGFALALRLPEDDPSAVVCGGYRAQTPRASFQERADRAVSARVAAQLAVIDREARRALTSAGALVAAAAPALMLERSQLPTVVILTTAGVVAATWTLDRRVRARRELPALGEVLARHVLPEGGEHGADPGEDAA